MEIDSVVFSLDKMKEDGTISEEQRGWLLVALAKTMQQAANTTGHFAQYLTPKESTLKRFVKQRLIGIKQSWIENIIELTPLGNKMWRNKNKAFNMDAIQLLENFSERKDKPHVIYADPPYTGDQYSRFYHIFETLIWYDYPSVTAKGRYRRTRLQSLFSMKAKAITAFERMAYNSKMLKADLVVSYPESGLLHKNNTNPKELLEKYYKKVVTCSIIPYKHSTFGASKGVSQQAVTEIVYWAQI